MVKGSFCSSSKYEAKSIVVLFPCFKLMASILYFSLGTVLVIVIVKVAAVDVISGYSSFAVIVKV